MLRGGWLWASAPGSKHFRDYVVAYTNAATIVTEDFADTEDLDGLFCGFDPEGRSYDLRTWQYQDVEVQAASGERDELYEERSHARQAGRGEAHGVGGDGAFFLLLDEPEVYGLRPDPVVTTRDIPAMWRHVGAAAATLTAAAVGRRP